MSELRSIESIMRAESDKIKNITFSPSILLGKGFRTQQFSIGSTPVRIIFGSRLKFFSIHVPTGDNVYLGHEAVTASSGILLPEGVETSFGVLENVEVYAVSAGTNTLYLLDMGLY